MTEYEQLDKLSGPCTTPHARGQRFNGVIAEMLQCWGIDARSSISTSSGELDVVFIHEGQRYLAEAKWEKAKTDSGPLFKLGGRLKQRLRGGLGIFLSMAGYTPEAIAGIGKGDQLDILLLDREHFEAMLSGLVPPQELLRLALDHAAFEGRADSSLSDLIRGEGALPSVSRAPADEVSTFPFLAPDVTAKVILRASGVDVDGFSLQSNANLLLASDSGIVEVVADSGTASLAVPLRGIHRNPFRSSDGSIHFLRQSGAAAYCNGKLLVTGGGFSEKSVIVGDLIGNVYVLDRPDAQSPYGTVLTKLGEGLGQQTTIEVATLFAGDPAGAIWTSEDALILVHNNFCSVTNLSGTVPQSRATGLANCTSVLPLGDGIMLIGGGQADIRLLIWETGRGVTLATLASSRSGIQLAQVSATEVRAAYKVTDPEPAVTIVTIEGAFSDSAFVKQMLAIADSGDLQQYTEEVRALGRQQIEQPSGDELLEDSFYYQLDVTVHRLLNKPLQSLLKAAGLQSVASNNRLPDGYNPPDYGTSASYMGYRRADVSSGPWLTALAGVGHRSWPEKNLNDVIIVMQLAVMYEFKQHTLLTRLVPIAPREANVQSIVDALLREAEGILPSALDYLDRPLPPLAG